MDDAGRGPLLVWGAGGHGKVVADLVRASGRGVVGFADADPTKLHRVVEPGGGRVIILEAELLTAFDRGRLPVGASGLALGIGANAIRARMLSLVLPERMPVLVHPSAVVSPSARLGAGTVVFPRVVVNADAVIGSGVILNSGCIVEHDCAVGDGAHVGPGATMCGGVGIGARTLLGAGSTVAPGVRIGADATVGAGSVVIRDLPDAVVAVGNPARPIARGGK